MWRVRRSNFVTPGGLVRTLRAACKDPSRPTSFVWLEGVYDFKSYYEPHLAELHGYTKALGLMFAKADDGKCRLWYKPLPASDPEWLGADGKAGGAGCVVLRSSPGGEPRWLKAQHKPHPDVVKDLQASYRFMSGHDQKWHEHFARTGDMQLTITGQRADGVFGQTALLDGGEPVIALVTPASNMWTLPKDKRPLQPQLPPVPIGRQRRIVVTNKRPNQVIKNWAKKEANSVFLKRTRQPHKTARLLLFWDRECCCMP